MGAFYACSKCYDTGLKHKYQKKRGKYVPTEHPCFCSSKKKLEAIKKRERILNQHRED